MSKTALTANLPCLIEVRDYHEFEVAEDFYKDIGLKLKVEEVCCCEGQYMGLVYKGRKPTKLIKAIQKANERCDEGTQDGWDFTSICKEVGVK